MLVTASWVELYQIFMKVPKKSLQIKFTNHSSRQSTELFSVLKLYK